jgi:RNA methyltransferase, TrmH family
VLSRREEKLLRGLAQRKIREAERCFVVEGVRAAEDLLASPLRVRFLAHLSSLGDGERGRALLERAAHRGIRTVTVDDADLARVADTQTPQGVVAVAEMPETRLDDLFRPSGPTVLLVLDAVQDPGNFGSMVRSAEALGAAGVVVLPGTVDPWNAKAVRSAMGASFRLPVVAADWAELGPWLRDHGFAVLAADAGGEPLGDDVPDRAALVLGNEGAGVSTETRIHADRVVGIPLRGRAESLNVGAAAAILLYELLRS